MARRPSYETIGAPAAISPRESRRISFGFDRALARTIREAPGYRESITSCTGIKDSEASGVCATTSAPGPTDREQPSTARTAAQSSTKKAVTWGSSAGDTADSKSARRFTRPANPDLLWRQEREPQDKLGVTLLLMAVFRRLLSISRFTNFYDLIGFEIGELLDLLARPFDLEALHCRRFAQPEMQSAVTLHEETKSAPRLS